MGIAEMTKIRMDIGRIVFLGIALGAALALVMVLLQGERLTGSRAMMAVFVGGPVLGIGLGLGGMMLPAAWRVTAAMSCLSAAIALWAFEAVLLMGKEQQAADSLSRRAEQLKVAFDARTKSQVLSDLRQSGRDVNPIVFPSLFLVPQGAAGTVRSPLAPGGRELQPLGGVPDTTQIVCNEAGSWLLQQTDRHGFNNPARVWDTGPVDLVMIGDSFVQGMCVPAGETFADLIRTKVPSAINLGAAGNGPLLELATLVEYAKELKPRTVLWFFFEGNDLEDLTVEARSSLLRGYLDGSSHQGLFSRNSEISAQLRDYVNIAMVKTEGLAGSGSALPWSQRITRFATLTETRVRLGLTAAGIAPPDYGLLEKTLATANQTVSGWNGRLKLVYLPTWDSATGTGAATLGIHDKVAAITGRLGIEMIDLRAEMAKHPDPASLFPLRGPGHYAAPGHALVAARVLDRLGTAP